ncbi:MAG: Tad domain-containing protein [Myxococcaceae bacterium]
MTRSSHRSRKSARGQNLVLLALTMLFLALMVTMTLGLGLRIRQKHELQNLADAAAYSNSVMTARTFNDMAIVNRLEVSYWVALAADQSIISWTGYAHAMANGVHNAADGILQSNCGKRLRPNVKNQVKNFRDDVRAYVLAELEGPANATWRLADDNAGREALQIQGTVAGLRDELTDGVVSTNPGNLRSEFYRAVQAQQLTRQIIAASKLNDVEVIDTGAGSNPNTAAKVSMREVDCDYGTGGNPALAGDEPAGFGLCLRGQMNETMLYAAMGSRGNPWVTGRGTVPGKVQQKLNQILRKYGAVGMTLGAPTGSGYWSDGLTDGNSPTTTESWADDHGTVNVTAGNCAQSEDIKGHVKSTHLVLTNDEHEWTPTLNGGDVDKKPDVFHTMGDCTPLCPSVWVRTIGFKPSDVELDAWGQPKMVVALERDLAKNQWPWELHFDFPFSATGPAGQWDGRGQELHTRTGKGLSIRKQTALATGIAYYHRRYHWDEFPNLLNPFWRATLAPMDIDSTEGPVGAADVQRSLSAPEYRWQRDAFRTLTGAGFQGLH